MYIFFFQEDTNIEKEGNYELLIYLINLTLILY